MYMGLATKEDNYFVVRNGKIVMIKTEEELNDLKSIHLIYSVF